MRILDTVVNLCSGASMREDPTRNGQVDERGDRRPDGRVAVVTGANSGLGLVTARELAARRGDASCSPHATRKGASRRAR